MLMDPQQQNHLLNTSMFFFSLPYDEARFSFRFLCLISCFEMTEFGHRQYILSRLSTWGKALLLSSRVRNTLRILGFLHAQQVRENFHEKILEHDGDMVFGVNSFASRTFMYHHTLINVRHLAFRFFVLNLMCD